MTISYPIDLPSTPPTSVEVGERNANRFETSPFTGRGTLQQFEGEWWTLRLTYNRLRRSLAQPILSFGSKLRKSYGTFVIPFPGYDEPLGTASTVGSSPSVDGNDQAGSDSLNIKSGPASESGWLLEGDIIQVGPASRPHWHRVLEDVDTDASGNATIEVWPLIRERTIDGDLVSTSSPLCIFRVTDVINTQIERPVLHTVDFQCREDI